MESLRGVRVFSLAQASMKPMVSVGALPRPRMVVFLVKGMSSPPRCRRRFCP